MAGGCCLISVYRVRDATAGDHQGRSKLAYQIIGARVALELCQTFIIHAYRKEPHQSDKARLCIVVEWA